MKMCQTSSSGWIKTCWPSIYYCQRYSAAPVDSLACSPFSNSFIQPSPLCLLFDTGHILKPIQQPHRLTDESIFDWCSWWMSGQSVDIVQADGETSDVTGPGGLTTSAGHLPVDVPGISFILTLPSSHAPWNPSSLHSVPPSSLPSIPSQTCSAAAVFNVSPPARVSFTRWHCSFIAEHMASSEVALTTNTYQNNKWTGRNLNQTVTFETDILLVDTMRAHGCRCLYKQKSFMQSGKGGQEMRREEKQLKANWSEMIKWWKLKLH